MYLHIVFNHFQIFDPRDYTTEFVKKHDRCDVKYDTKKKKLESVLESAMKFVHDDEDCDNDLKNDKKVFLGKSTIF